MTLYCCSFTARNFIIILILLIFLLSFTLFLFYNINLSSISSFRGVEILTNERRIECDANLSSKEIVPDLKNKTTSTELFTDYYKELILQRVGDKSFLYNGTVTEIALLSAFEYVTQVNIMITSEGNYGKEVYCRYFTKLKEEIGKSFKSVVFPQYTVQCLRREGAVYISLSNTTDGAYKFPVPIIDRTEPNPTHFFSVCLAPLYGAEAKWLQIAEFVEHYKIQGATHFYLYDVHIDGYSRNIIDDYVRTGEVEVVALHEPIDRQPLRWQHVQIQECLQRARGHSHWVAMVDLDERLTPTYYPGNIEEYLRDIGNETIGGIQYRQQYIVRNESFPEKYADRAQVAEWMPTLRYHNSSHVAVSGYVAKCIIDPKKVLVMEIHFVEKFFDNFTLYEAKPDEIVVRQYRRFFFDHKGDMGYLLSIQRMGNFSLTDYPEKWMAKLRINVQERIEYVYGSD